MPNQLLIAIDPGFDSMKVIANGEHFKFPFSAVETDERKMSDYGSRTGFILYKDESGATWRVGQYARGIIFDNKGQDDTLKGFYTEERFIADEMVVGIRSAIAMAIDKAGCYDKQGDLDIKLMVALPHGVRTKYASTITGLAAGDHSYYMTFGNGKERPFKYTVREGDVYTVSQTIAAILGETSDDNGYINEEKYFYLSNGPTLVIDGGYYTMGMVPVSRGATVDDTRAESNTSHAMKNVNMAVAQEIADCRPDIKHYAVEYLMAQGEDKVRYMDKGKVRTIDLGPIRQEKIKSVCASFIKYLSKKYNNLLDFKYVLVTGGTGACYFDQMLNYYVNAGIMDEQHMLLTIPEVGNVEMPIEFAIVAGAYKGLRGVLQ